MRRVALLLSALLAGLPAPAAAQQSVEDFYRGRKIDLIIGYSPGGTYDLYARLVARHLGHHIPGRPLIVPRWNAIRKGREDLLITRTDDRVAAGLLVLVLVVVIGGYRYTTQKYEYVVPLQAGSFKTKPLPQVPSLVAVEMKDATYDVPGRSLRLDVEITNQSESPMRLGEFTTANLRFLDKSLDVAVADVHPGHRSSPTCSTVIVTDAPGGPTATPPSTSTALPGSPFGPGGP